MNCDVASQDKCFYLATGMEDSCSVHILRYKVMVPKVEKEGRFFKIYLTHILWLKLNLYSIDYSCRRSKKEKKQLHKFHKPQHGS